MEGRLTFMALPTYFSPNSVGEAISLLSKYGDKARVISGGTDLLVQMKRNVLLPNYLISVNNIRDLDYIMYDQTNGLRIGALTTIGNVANSPLIQGKFSVLAQGASLLGTPAIKNQGTIGGNLCNAAPSADIAPPLIVLGALAKFAGTDGERIVPIEDFFVGPGATIMKHHQLLLEIQIPDPRLRSGGAYIKQTRGRGADLAVVGVAAFVVMDGEVIGDVKIALGAVAPTPIRARRAETILKGMKLNDKLLDESGQVASYEGKPIDDVRSSADYRRRLVVVLTKRAVVQAVQQAQSEA
jgi:carbon-monoxide dehydrogenase medium subunit